MRLCDVGLKVVKCILRELEDKHISCPTEISLGILEELTGCRVQDIGMAFDSYIIKTLRENGIEARKCGKPVVIQLKRI